MYKLQVIYLKIKSVLTDFFPKSNKLLWCLSGNRGNWGLEMLGEQWHFSLNGISVCKLAFHNTHTRHTAIMYSHNIVTVHNSIVILGCIFAACWLTMSELNIIAYCQHGSSYSSAKSSLSTARIHCIEIPTYILHKNCIII